MATSLQVKAHREQEGLVLPWVQKILQKCSIPQHALQQKKMRVEVEP